MAERQESDVAVVVLGEVGQIGRREVGGDGEVEAEPDVTHVVGEQEPACGGLLVVRDRDCEVEVESASTQPHPERAAVVAVGDDRGDGPRSAQDDCERDDRARAEVERVHHQQQHAGRADGHRDPDAFHAGLYGHPLLDGEHLEDGVDRAARHAVVERDVDDLGGHHDGEQCERRLAGAEGRDQHRDRQHGHRRRVGDETEAQPEAHQQPPGEHAEEGDVDRVQDTRVQSEEPGQLGRIVVAGRGPVEHQEVDDLAPHRRQHLVGEHEHDESGREQRAHRALGTVLSGYVDDGQLGGPSPRGDPDEDHEQDP